MRINYVILRGIVRTRSTRGSLSTILSNCDFSDQTRKKMAKKIAWVFTGWWMIQFVYFQFLNFRVQYGLCVSRMVNGYTVDRRTKQLRFGILKARTTV